MSGRRSLLHPVSSAAGSDAQPAGAPRSGPGFLGARTPLSGPAGRPGCGGAGSGPRRGAGAVGGGARRGQPGAGGEPVPGVLGSAACPAARLCSSRGQAGTGRVGSSARLGACKARLDGRGRGRGRPALAAGGGGGPARRGAAGARRMAAAAAAGGIATLPDDGGSGAFPPGHFKDPKRLYCKNGGFFLRINPDGKVDGVREKSDPHSECVPGPPRAAPGRAGGSSPGQRGCERGRASAVPPCRSFGSEPCLQSARKCAECCCANNREYADGVNSRRVNSCPWPTAGGPAPAPAGCPGAKPRWRLRTQPAGYRARQVHTGLVTGLKGSRVCLRGS